MNPLTIIAQDTGPDWSNLLYLLVFAFLAVANKAIEWFGGRKGEQKEKEEGTVTSLLKAVADEDDDEEWIEITPIEPEIPRPQEPRQTSRPVPVARVPQAPVSTAPARPVPPPPTQPQRQPKQAVVQQVSRKQESKGRSPSHGAVQKKAPAAQAEKRPSGAVPTRGVFAGKVLDMKSLQKAIMLNEILSPPLALRKPGESPMDRTL